MTVDLDDVSDATDTDADDDERLDVVSVAGWWQRAAAFGIDVVVGLGLAATLLMVGASAQAGWVWWVFVVAAAVVVIAVAVNRWVLPYFTGWSLGRSVAGIAVDDRGGGAPPWWRLPVRDLAHVLDTLPFCLGWLWPLLDARGRTFADILAGTEVHRVDGDHPDRRTPVARLIGAAALLSVVTAGVGYGVVHRQHRALDEARAQIAEEGPGLVSDMLSYTVKTAAEDFTHAQSLVTEGYRPELINQQESVKKNGLVDNDYWVSNSAVLSSSQDRAAMLLLLQGQRGVAPTQRFVTASVRAEYEKQGGRWLVSNLTVLASPKPTPPPAPKPSPAPAPKPTPAPAKGGR